jgi:hypothetical protein
LIWLNLPVDDRQFGYTLPPPPKHCSESQVLNLMSQEQEAFDGMKGDIEVT